MSVRIVSLVACAVLLSCLGATSPPSTQPKPIEYRLISDDREEAKAAVAEVRAMLAADPRRTVDRLNERLMGFMFSRHGAEVEEFAIAGSIAVARETWPIEQLQRHRITALREFGKPKEALSAAKALFNVSGLGSTPYCINELCRCLREAYPNDKGIVYRFRLQQLAAAQTDPEERRKAWEGLGENILASIPIDPKPYEQAIDNLRGRSDYDSLYAMGNLLLLAGRTKEAVDVFERAYKVAPPRETSYATEGLAKAMKAEDGGIGRCNAFILSVRPRQ